MMTSLLLGTALLSPGAPVPADSLSNPVGPAPRVAYLKADANGNVTVYGFTLQKMKVTQTRQVFENGQQVIKQEQVEQTRQVYFQRQLTESGVKLTTADGTELGASDAVARVKDGAAVLISADGKSVEKSWLRAVNPDTVVVTSNALADAVIIPQGVNLPTTSAPRLVLLAADADGKVSIAYNPTSGDPNLGQYEEQVFMARGNVQVFNGRVMQRGGFDANIPGVQSGQTEFPGKLLDDVKFDAFDLKGNLVPRSEAMKRLKAGGYVLIAGDGRLPDADYLKAFQGELLVLVSSELILPPGATVKPTASPVRAKLGVAAPALQLVPAAPLPVALPAVKPLQVAPVPLIRPVGGLKALPAPVPVQEDKPAEKAPAPKKD